MKRFLLTLAACAIPAIAAAQAWPDKPLKVVVPFGPGGSSDLMARLLQKTIEDEKLLPQPMAIVNVKGHFSIGSQQVKNAAPDGTNFLVLHLALLSGEVVDPSKGISYRDFEPVAMTGGFCLHHIVRDDAPWKTLDDLVKDEKRQIWLWALLFAGAVVVLTFRDQLPSAPSAGPAPVTSEAR